MCHFNTNAHHKLDFMVRFEVASQQDRASMGTCNQSSRASNLWIEESKAMCFMQ